MFELTEKKMDQVFGMLKEDLAVIKTSRISSSLVENILVEAYKDSASLKIKELGSIVVEGASTLSIQPWDPKVLRNIAAAIEENKTGLSAVISGQKVRVKTPPLSQDRREDQVKLIKNKLESTRVMIRQVRSEKRSEILEQKEGGKLGEDEAFREEETLQQLTDQYIDKVDKLGEEKIVSLRSF